MGVISVAENEKKCKRGVGQNGATGSLGNARKMGLRGPVVEWIYINI